MKQVQRPPGVQRLGGSEGPGDPCGWVARRAKETWKRFKMIKRGGQEPDYSEGKRALAGRWNFILRTVGFGNGFFFFLIKDFIYVFGKEGERARA